MADRAQFIKYIESYVDSSSSPSQQAASADAIAKLLKTDLLTIEYLVREMEMYLTTTDSIIRARGILLLGELLTHLALKPLDKATIHSLIGFFTERLADWKALHGALVGSLALLRRKRNVGMVSGAEAKEFALSYMQNLQVQALGQHDRKLCFELLECLLDRFPDAVVSLGEEFIYGICEAIDGEKDPNCLLLTFHIVEILAQLFPDPSGVLGSFAGDLFDILGSYFPIHFTHAKGEDVDMKKEELSRALMRAFASTSLFEPFSIPLLLEKLSSSLLLAKVESLKYLSYCAVKYGAERMAKYVEALWPSIKETIYTSRQSSLSLEPETLDPMSFQEDEIVKEALVLLENVTLQNNGLFLSLILSDEDINSAINSIINFNGYNDISMENKLTLYAVGCILSVSAKASNASCNIVFESLFPRLLVALGISVQDSPRDGFPNEGHNISASPKFGALYLCVELLSACRCLIVGANEFSPVTISPDEAWCSMLQKFCSSLTAAFCYTLLNSMGDGTQDAYIHCGVKGLQILATFPESFLSVPKPIFEKILMNLMSIITSFFNKTMIWKLVLKAVVEIGSFINKFHQSEKAESFESIVVEKIVSLMSCDDSTLPSSQKVQAISEIGMTGLNFMLRIINGLNKAISSNLSEVYVHGNLKTVDITVQLLECYSRKLLPWFDAIGGSSEVPLHFAVNIWEQVETITSFSAEKDLLGATMTAMKHSVASCSQEHQSTIVHKAFSIFSSSNTFHLEESISGTAMVKMEGLQLTSENGYSCRDKCITSLFASVIIALHPETRIPNVKEALHLFVTSFLGGQVPAAQALACLVNKLPLRINGADISNNLSLEEAIDIIFNNNICIGNGSDMGVTSLRVGGMNKSLQGDVIVGLAWIGKGLLMRGHEKVKDMAMLLLSCLLSDHNIGASSLRQEQLKDSKEQEWVCLMKSAADAFHILMSDSEDCLNRRFHATIRPLYKQRFFSIMMPILLSSVVKSDSSVTRSMLHRAISHVISNTPLSAILGEANKLIPIIVDGLSVLSEDTMNKDVIYNVLLVLSQIVIDKNGRDAVIENAHNIIGCLIRLTSYRHMMLIRETSIQCLLAMSELPHSRVYPMKMQVQQAISKALDDPKRAVRREAVRCRQAWA